MCLSPFLSRLASCEARIHGQVGERMGPCNKLPRVGCIKGPCTFHLNYFPVCAISANSVVVLGNSQLQMTGTSRPRRDVEWADVPPPPAQLTVLSRESVE